MKLQSIQLANFRAFEALSLTLGEKVTLLIGENGSGTTSILDGIPLCQPSTGQRLSEIT